MSWTRVAAMFSAVAIVASATVAMATDQDYGRSGPYVAGGGAYGFENFDVNGVNFDDSWGYFLKGGYRFNQWFSLELNWEQYLDFQDHPDHKDSDIWAIGVNAKVFPFHGIIQPYFLVGGSYYKLNLSNSVEAAGEDGGSGFGVRFAGGLDVYVTRNWAFSVDAGYLLPTSSSDFGIIPITFGVMYRFY
jgi:hypothetical protein